MAEPFSGLKRYAPVLARRFVPKFGAKPQYDA